MLTIETIATPPVYGITHNIYSHNPKYVLLHEHKKVFRKVSKINGLKNKISFLFSKSGESIAHFKKLGQTNRENKQNYFIHH
jgi:hypothetical protein